MKSNETKIFVFIATVIIGILIAMNISFGAPETKVLNAKQYQDAANEKVKLYNDITQLEKQYNETLSKLKRYSSGSTSDGKILDGIKNELDANKRILGLEGVEGKGIEITLNDATNTFDGSILEDEYLQWARIVHNTDVLQVVNCLRVAGAEAISINGQRIMANSEFYCWGPFLKINGVNISAPFYISAVGNSDAINQYLCSEEGYLTFLKYRGIEVKVEKEENVKIPAYIGNYTTKFSKKS